MWRLVAPPRASGMYLDEHAFVCLREEEGRMEIARRPTEARLLEIVLHEQIYDVYLALLEYLYTDRVEGLDPKSVQLEFALDLLAVADQYLPDPLKRMCEKAIHKSIDVDNVAYMLATADARQAHELRKKCFDFITIGAGEISQ